jgi:hypothetical protein
MDVFEFERLTSLPTEAGHFLLYGGRCVRLMFEIK